MWSPSDTKSSAATSSWASCCASGALRCAVGAELSGTLACIVQETTAGPPVPAATVDMCSMPVQR